VVVNTPELADPEMLHAPGVADMTELARAACARYGFSPDCTMLTAYAGLRHDTDLAAEMRRCGYNAETCAIAEPYLSRFG
jgi:hypothetical protein